MSLIITRKATPETPATDKAVVYQKNTNRRLSVIDDRGLDAELNNVGLKDFNVLTNGGFQVQQRVAVASTAIPGVSTTTRAGQVADRWAVTTGNATTTSWQQADTSAAPETGLESRFYGRITQATNAAKFILSQFMPHHDMSNLRGRKVRLSCKIKQFVGSNQVYKLGLLQLTAAGTVDTSPAFISAIGASGVNPTWGTNLSPIAPDAAPAGENGTINGSYLEITSGTVWARSSAVFTIPTDAKNLVVVLIKDATGGATDSVGIAEMQLTQGVEIVDYVETPFAWDLERCQRFFAKSFPYSVVPAASIAGGAGAVCGIIGKAAATALAVVIPIRYPVRMHSASPVVTLFTPIGAGAVPYRINGTTPAVQTSAATTQATDNSIVVTATGDANGAVGDLVGVHYTADAEFRA